MHRGSHYAGWDGGWDVPFHTRDPRSCRVVAVSSRVADVFSS